MNKVSSSGLGVARSKKPIVVNFEVEMASLLSDLSEIYNKIMLLTEKLQCHGCCRSSTEAFEAAIMLKHALGISVDAMSHLPGSANTVKNRSASRGL